MEVTVRNWTVTASHQGFCAVDSSTRLWTAPGTIENRCSAESRAKVRPGRASRPHLRGNRGPAATALLPGAALDAGGQLGHLGVGGTALAHQVGDLLDRVHDRGVVLAAEGRTDAGQRQLGQLAAQV